MTLFVLTDSNELNCDNATEDAPSTSVSGLDDGVTIIPHALTSDGKGSICLIKTSTGLA